MTSQVSPALFIRWDEDLSNTNRFSTVILKRFAAPSIDPNAAAKYAFRYVAAGNVAVLRSINGEIIPAGKIEVARFSFWNWVAEMQVGDVIVYRTMRPDNLWTYEVVITNTNMSVTGCGPFMHRTGRVSARVWGPGGGFLFTGDLNVHSGGGDKSHVFDPANPWTLTQCEVIRSTWCEL